MRRFFCENCGEEVRENDEICRYCGAVFVAIKCPRCGYRGKMHEFRKGCPSCGFLGEDQVRETRPGDRRVKRIGRATRIHRLFRGVGRVGKASAETPTWLFWLIIVMMVLAFGVLSLVYTSI
jgi:predicted RNA-binding Zn-ribbon protein involved in translation (DUF1610 family)